jgi:tetraacyldisaccharide-1-P 4'-kinase
MALAGLMAATRITGKPLPEQQIMFLGAGSAATGIADPTVFEAQLTRLGADITCLQWPDHHAYRDSDIALMFQKSRRLDYVVVTEKDAAKLERRWPRHAVPLLVAQLDVDWGNNYERVVSALDALVAHRAL